MPDQPSWIDRITEIRAALAGLPQEIQFVDRPSVERIFGLSARQANRLIRGCPETITIGRSVLAHRDGLRKLVEMPERSGVAEREVRRREKLHRVLGLARQEARRRSIQIPVVEDVWSRQFTDLAEGAIRLKPGELSIEFSSPMDLLQKLFELSQAIANDPEGFEAKAR